MFKVRTLARLPLHSLQYRFLSEASASAVAVPVAVAATPDKAVDPNDPDVLALAAIKNPKSAALFVHNYQFINRRENPTNSKFTHWGLLTLFNLVKSPEDGKYVLILTERFQKKGFDFTPQVAAGFAQACVTGAVSKAAAEHCAQWKNRMGAWLPPSAVAILVEDLCKQDELEAAVSMLSTISKKGAIAKEATIETLLASIVGSPQEDKRAEWYSGVVTSAGTMIAPDVLSGLTTKYPAPAAPAPTAAETEAATEPVEPDSEVKG